MDVSNEIWMFSNDIWMFSINMQIWFVSASAYMAQYLMLMFISLPFYVDMLSLRFI